MSLQAFLQDFNTVNKQILELEKTGLTLTEAVTELISKGFEKLGYIDLTQHDVEDINKSIKSDLTLAFLHAVKFNLSDDNNYVILKYNTRYAKFYKHSKYARSLVLNRVPDNIQVISYGFTKFYNLGEKEVFPETIQELIDKEKVAYLANKLDGTNITSRNFNGTLITNTTGTLSKMPIIYKGEEYPNHIIEAEKNFNENTLNMINENPDIAFIFELIGVQQIIVEYTEKDFGLHLIGARKFLNAEGTESVMLSQPEIKEIAEKYNVRSVDIQEINSITSAIDLVNGEQFEGLEGSVIYVGQDIVKIKRDDYVLAHQLKMKHTLKTTSDLKQFINLLTPLIVNESIDDYIGIYKGNIPTHVEYLIEKISLEFEKFDFMVFSLKEKNPNLTIKDFNMNFNSYNIDKKFQSIICRYLINKPYKNSLIELIVNKIYTENIHTVENGKFEVPNN